MRHASDAQLAEAFASADGDQVEALRAIYSMGVRDALGREPSEFAARRWRRVLQALAGRHGMTVGHMLERGWHQGSIPVQALHETCWVLRMHAKLSFPVIGDVVGRDHTSVMAAVRKVEARIAARPELRDELLAAVHGGRGDARIAAVGR